MAGTFREKMTGEIPKRNVKGFTLTELLVVIACLAILASLLLPVLASAKAKAQSAKCKSNLGQIDLALPMYVFSAYPLNIHFTPQGGVFFWADDLDEYLKQPFGGGGKDPIWRIGVWQCPGGKSPGLYFDRQFRPGWRPFCGSYGYNFGGLGMFTNSSLYPSLGLSGWVPDGKPGGGIAVPVRETEVAVPSDMLALGDNFRNRNHKVEASGLGRIDQPQPPDPPDDPFSPYQRHQRQMNVSFCDGHIEGASIETMMFKQSDAVLRRLNKDNEPHWERVK